MSTSARETCSCRRTAHSWKANFMDPMARFHLWKVKETNRTIVGFAHNFTRMFLCAHKVSTGDGVGQLGTELEGLKPEHMETKIQEQLGSSNHLHISDLHSLGNQCHTPQPGAHSCKIASLQEALASLEQQLSPPSVENFACILQRCKRERNSAYANRLHNCIRRSGLENHTSIGNHLVVLLVDVGSIDNAQQVFDRLDRRSECTWNTLAVGYISIGEFEQAYTLFQNMQRDSIHINLYTFVALLKACAKLKDLKIGQEIHDEVFRKGLEKELFVGSTLVYMYANCGLLAKAQGMFDKLPVQDVVLWNTLIAGYTQHGRVNDALKCFQQMQLEGHCADNVTYVLILKACGSTGAIQKGQEIHCGIAIQGHLRTDLKVGNALVDMYVKCGLLWIARVVLNNLPVRDAVSWNALIAGYAKQGLPQEALNCYEQMHSEGVFPDAVTLACSLKACGSIRSAVTGLKIHVEISRRGLLDRDIVVGNALVDMYGKCGLLSKAQAVFNRLPLRDAVSWTALITGYVQHENGEEALNCFQQMQRQGVSPDAVALLCSLKACSTTGAVDIGHQIHAEIARKGLMERDLVGNTLIDMYAKCGLIGKAQEVFDNFSNRDVVSWNALIGGYAKHGYGDEALDCFEEMQFEGVSLDAVTFVCVLNACGAVGATAIHIGHELHAEIARNGLLEKDIVLGNALVDMYAKCGALAKAHEVFDKLIIHDTTSWNGLIAGYVQHGLFHEAVNCFDQMQRKGGVVPDTPTYACVLKACGSIRNTYKGCEIHAEISRKGLLESNLVIGNVLVDMYCNCGLLAKAQEVFDRLLVWDVVSWTVLIAGYTKHGRNEEALDVFKEMQLEEFAPGIVTYVCILTACGNLGAIDMGLVMHAEIARKGLLEGDLIVCNAIIDMYANCGLLALAQEIFDHLPIRSIVSWSSLIAGYAQIGDTAQAFFVLERMEAEGESPNLITFVSVLNACSHAGLVEKGHVYFEEMSKHFGLTPGVEHHTCMLDLLSRAGQLNKAVAMIRKMPFHPNLVIWHTMLGACKKWGNIELGREAFEHAMRIDEKDVAAFVCMSNIYADADMPEEADKVDALLVEKVFY